MRARGEYVLLLNNDTIVDKGFLEPLVKKMQSDTKIGCVSSKLRFYYDRSVIQFAGYTPIDHRTMRSFAIGYREKDKGQYDTDKETPYAHGAAMMVSMKVIREIGIMSYIFFLYYEEADWSYRIKNAGYTIWYVHNSLVKNVLSKPQQACFYEAECDGKGLLPGYIISARSCNSKKRFQVPGERPADLLLCLCEGDRMASQKHCQSTDSRQSIFVTNFWIPLLIRLYLH
jgi:hypothetical protein